jgi:predicted DsbA family dithiol-disulfide isomerase
VSKNIGIVFLLKEEYKMNNITVYTTNTCPYCTMVKNFLDEQGLEYKEVNVQNDQREAQKTGCNHWTNGSAADQCEWQLGHWL